MAGVVFAVNSALLLACLLGSPAPQAIGVWEVTLAGAIAFTVGLLVITRMTGAMTARFREQLVPLLLLPAIGIPLIISAAVGLTAGVSLGAAVRASVPYALFLPVILLGFIVGRRGSLWVITIPLAIAGVLQSLYLLGLFVVTVPDLGDVRSVWVLRTTLLDPRTTLPLLLAAATLPLAWRERSTKRVYRLLGWVPAGLALAAALSTQTRSQVLAVLVGIGSYLVASGVMRLRASGKSWTTVGTRVGTRLAASVVLALLLALAFAPTRAMVLAVVLRSQSSLDTGRFSDEWEPAMDAVLSRGIPGVTAGIGAGESFVTAAGEERTYVHNLLLYGLVYFGGPGLGLILLGYLIVFLGLLRRGARSGDMRFLALAAMVAAMFVFAQFFAVHKLFSYNLMLALAAQALTQPPPAPRGAW